VRLILLARDPVERAFSQYKHWVKETGYRGTFEGFAAEHPNCVDRGFYHRQLARYLDRFPRDQIDVVLFEDLISDPQSAMEGVFGFIGVDPSVQITAEGPVNASEIPRHHRLYTVARKGAMWAYSNDHPWLVSWAKRLGASRPLVSADREASFEPMRAETRARLAAGYEDDVAALGALIGRDLSAVWRSAAAAGAPASGG